MTGHLVIPGNEMFVSTANARFVRFHWSTMQLNLSIEIEMSRKKDFRLHRVKRLTSGGEESNCVMAIIVFAIA